MSHAVIMWIELFPDEKRKPSLLLLRVGQSPVVMMGREIGTGTVGILADAGDGGGGKLFISSLE